MRMLADKYIKQQIEIEIDGITLLSLEEAQQVPVEKLAIGCWWWLRSPGNDRYYAADVSFDGRVNSNGYNVHITDDVVRPALKISNQESANLEIGDRFDALGYTWTYVLDGLALCDTSIGKHRFDSISNCWKTSELKQWLENWLTKKMEEMKENAKRAIINLGFDLLEHYKEE